MNTALRIRNVVMILTGVLALLMKGWFLGAASSLAHNYLGNVSASFAVYFLVSNAPIPGLRRAWVAVVALAIVEAFELTNGFGVMTNTYDPFDYLANILGVALAFGADRVSARALPSGTPDLVGRGRLRRLG